jgi:anionic cell wall polymer biosynthesis LytR-Cps2A-Psr (LCP) family protein
MFTAKLPYRTAIMAGLGVLVGIVGLFAYFSYHTWDKVSVKTSTPEAVSAQDQVDAGPQPISIALLGYGGGGHQGGLLTDTIIVARIDPKLERVFLITIPRDTWVQLPVNGEALSGWKINAAYQIGADDRRYPYKLPMYQGEGGGGTLAKYALGQVVGFPIDYFVAISFSGFTRSIDVLNGVEVDVEKSFDDYWYPIEGMEDESCGKSEEEIAAVTATLSGLLLEQQFPCRYEHLSFNRGITKMDGATALKYARSRHSSTDGSDFARSQRQRNVILAVKEKVLRLEFLPKLIPFISTLSQDMKTDIPLEQMQEFIQKKDELSAYPITSIALTDKNVLRNGRSSDGQYILMPSEGENQWDNIHTWLRDQMAQAASASAQMEIQ